MTGLWLALAAALLAGYVSALHHALHHYSRSRLEEVLERRGRPHRVALLERRTQFVLLTGFLRAVLHLIILMGMVAWLAPPGAVTSWSSLLAAFCAAAVLITVVVVAVPTSWGRYAAEPLLAVSLPLLAVLARLLAPFVAGLHLFDPLVRRLLGVPKAMPDDTSEIEQEILDKVSEGEKAGHVDENQADMIEAIVEFPTMSVDQIMTPRTDVIGLESDLTLEEVKRLTREAGHSRFPVYEENLDNVVGMLYVKDLLPLVGTSTDAAAFKLTEHVRSAVFVPETKSVIDLLSEMRSEKVHMALVLDEYGGTAGLVTFEDIVEEIVGDVRDEYEPETRVDPSIDLIGETAAEVDGRAYIDDVNDMLQLRLPEDGDYDTIGGFVFATLGHIPDVGESFEFNQTIFTVTDAERTRVNRVRIEPVTANGLRESNPSDNDNS